MDLDHAVPLVIGPNQTIGELMELGAFRDFDEIVYSVRKRRFYGIRGEEETCALLRPQAGELDEDANLTLMLNALGAIEKALQR